MSLFSWHRTHPSDIPWCVPLRVTPRTVYKDKESLGTRAPLHVEQILSNPERPIQFNFIDFSMEFHMWTNNVKKLLTLWRERKKIPFNQNDFSVSVVINVSHQAAPLVPAAPSSCPFSWCGPSWSSSKKEIPWQHKQGFHTQAKRVQVLHTGVLGQFHIYISEF